LQRELVVVRLSGLLSAGLEASYYPGDNVGLLGKEFAMPSVLHPFDSDVCANCGCAFCVRL
ncbi:MAG TPA: hypothetical protein DD502_29780, partial [Cupriavidus sp.]|nr:hypothetical protein [Cupriavidus sp.]